GSDGTLGLKSVKEYGGLAVAQNPDTAKYDSMPRNAAHTGLVDMVLDVEKIPNSLITFLDKSKVLKKEIEEDQEVELHLESIFAELESRTQHEFNGYKKNTILRRIRRRMQLLQIDSLESYTKKVRNDREEAEMLFKDLLIGVTHFFRDTSSFEYLQERIIPMLLKDKNKSGSATGLRVWVPGCATGEEAYTLAMIIRDEAAKLEASLPVQIFATDIDENALTTARRATYPEGIEDQVPEKYLSKYFTKQGNHYQVKKSVREMCIFSPHNLISNPPYSRIDLITCRNLLIYFDTHLQRKILPIFHYSLNKGGYLFLGPSENISARAELFRVNSKTHKVFQALENVPPTLIDFPLGKSPARSTAATGKPGFLEQKRNQEHILAKAFENKILERYIPFSAVINNNGDIFYWAGPRSKYLDHPKGIPRNNLLDIVNKSLRLTLRSLLHKSATTGGEVEQNDVVVETVEGLQRLKVSLSPFEELEGDAELFLAVIREIGPAKTPTESERAGAQSSGEEVIRQLEEELRDTKAYLQSTIEEMETSNEELKSSNEELLSMNEELQSSNEELQTSKEELQSVNEELETVNTELKNKVNELDDANSDLKNLYESNQIATLFLDNELRIKTFTPMATELFRLIETDMNRPIGDIVSRFKGVDLVKEAREVLDRLEKRSHEIVHSDTGRHYIMQMMPYRSVNNTIDGITISYVDVTDLKLAKEDLEIRERMLTLVTDSVPVLISYIDTDLTYRYCNAAYGKWFGLQNDEVIGQTMTDVLGKEVVAQVQPHIDRVLRGKTAHFNANLDYRHDGEKIVSGRYEPHVSNDGKILGFIAFVQDESKRVIRERKLGRLAAIVNSTHEVIIGCTTEGVITDWNRGAENLYGYTAEEAVDNHIKFIVPEERQEELDRVYAGLLDGKRFEPFETERLTKSGEIKHILLSLDPIHDDEGEVLGISTVAHDITDRVTAEDQLAQLNENLEQQVEKRTKQLHNLTAGMLSLEQRERKKFSQYLHDEIQQTLAGAKLQVEQAYSEVEGERGSAPLSAGLRLLSEAIKNSRSMTSDMSPPLFFENGIKICMQWVERWAGEKLGLNVTTRFKGDDRPINEEAGYLIFRSMRELLVNISKHAGVKEATIGACFTSDGGFKATVIDEGKGFDPEILKTQVTEHFGLLSIIEQIRSIGGSIMLDSVVGEGTKITIRLSAEVIEDLEVTYVPVSDKINSIAKENQARVEGADNEMISILIVDDQEDLRLTLRLMLEEIGGNFIFLEAGNCEQALEVVRQYRPSLVLMDVSMPGMSGVEATRKIMEEHEDLAIIGLSMHERESMEEAMRDAGAVDYVTKDSPPIDIMEVIKKVL
ncbi:MAG TPA: CheR family methyltransferase, partial [Desulfopila sp.]|nr:CheR family methyltransferase [Desulfopila sp.]